MKALTQAELQTFVTTLAPLLEGAQLQDVLANDRGLALGFRKQVHYWLILDLYPPAPMVLLFEDECPFRKGPKPKPVSLFLNSHAKNLYFEKIWIEKSLGRVLKIALKNSERDCELEIQLIPKQCNLLVFAGGKSIAWEKPKELKEAPVIENQEAGRSLEQLQQEWLAEQKAPQKTSLDPLAQWEKQRQKDLEKKRKAVGEIQKQIDSEEGQEWAAAGQALKYSGSLDVAEELRAFVDKSQSLSWNIENCFRKAKLFQGKKEGARARVALVMTEIAQLEKAKYSPRVSQKTTLVDLMQKAEARGRKLKLASGSLAYCGKNAADNLALLRQAKAWDLWLHLKDYPGAHAIIHRQRDQIISEAELIQVSEWLAKESLSSKSLMLGQKMAVVIVECRFVRPIKGDKLGRVNYHSEKTLHFVMTGSSRQS